MSAPLTGCILDREVALLRVGGDVELLKEIAVLFLENYEAWLGELREAAARGDAKVVENTAHGLKGSVANFGARDAVAASVELENLGRTGNLAGMQESLASVRKLKNEMSERNRAIDTPAELISEETQFGNEVPRASDESEEVVSELVLHHSRPLGQH